LSNKLYTPGYKFLYNQQSFRIMHDIDKFLLGVKYFKLKRLRYFLENAGETRESLATILETNTDEIRNLVLGELEHADEGLIDDAILLTEIYAHTLENPEVKIDEFRYRLEKSRNPESIWGANGLSLKEYISTRQRIGIRTAHRDMFPRQYNTEEK